MAQVQGDYEYAGLKFKFQVEHCFQRDFLKQNRVKQKPPTTTQNSTNRGENMLVYRSMCPVEKSVRKSRGRRAASGALIQSGSLRGARFTMIWGYGARGCFQLKL